MVEQIRAAQADFSAIETRILANELGLAVDEVVKLPKKHPVRFALLYGMGARKLLKLAEEYSKDVPEVIKRKMTHEPVREFENWQAGENEEALFQLRKENAAIAYAAMEAGIPPKAPKATQEQESPTGRLSAKRWAGATNFSFGCVTRALPGEPRERR